MDHPWLGVPFASPPSRSQAVTAPAPATHLPQGWANQAITLEWENDVINMLDFDGFCPLPIFLDYPKLSCREQPRSGWTGGRCGGRNSGLFF